MDRDRMNRMDRTAENFYNVTEWPHGDAHEDIGAVINDIIADIKKRQSSTDHDAECGKPGAVIYIPSGDYHLRTQVFIDISYLRIEGSGHGFVSSSIRFNIPEKDWKDMHELWPGGSRILVNLEADPNDETAGAAFVVKREGNPRISSVEFVGFCIDGLHFVDDGTGEDIPENTYLNGKTGIYIASAQDSFRITNMGFIYLEHGLVIHNADALTIHDNFIAECGNCIELRSAGQASKITDNPMGAGYRGYSIYAQNFGGLLIADNNIFPRGTSMVHFENVVRSTVTSNRFHSFYPGMLILSGCCSENLVAANHFYRAREPWAPMQMHDNGLMDDYGLVRVSGNNNSIVANHFSEIIDTPYIKPVGTSPVILYLAAGHGNYVATNHIVAATEAAAAADTSAAACFAAQVGAMISNQDAEEFPVVTVQVAEASSANIVLDSGTESQVVLDRKRNAFRPTPDIPR